MRWFVYYDKGRCNDGDHDNGLEGFDTRELALLRISELRSTNYSEDNDVIGMIEGESREVPEEYV